jgi:branched-subunit amino acid ABC-type transport system permease component
MKRVLRIASEHGLLLACLLILLSIGQAVATIEQYPDLQNDEAYFGIPAFELATNGRLRNRVTCLAGAEEKELYPFLVSVSLAPVFWLDRDAGPAALRLVSIAVSIAVLVALWFLLTRRLHFSP